jgi:hypothetical protein
MKARAWSLVALSLFALPVRGWGYCPSYTLSSAQNSANCGVEAASGSNPSLSAWQELFATVARGKAGWGSEGPEVASLTRGCGKPQPKTTEPATFPCEVLRGIAMQESNWRQFCVPDRPTDQVGGESRTIISFDCGYGVSQVTSGMHVGESPAYNRSRVASDALYNLATGASILAGKWKATACVGDNQPDLIEDWYTSLWAYNSLAYRNSPNNPNYASDRGVWDPTTGDAAPYQEKILGWLEHPPTAAHWESVAAAYPDLLEIGGGVAPPALSEPACASPTDCAKKRDVHRSACAGGAVDAGTTLTPLDSDAGAQVMPPAPSNELHEERRGCGCAGGAGQLGVIAWLVASLAAGPRRRLLR